MSEENNEVKTNPYTGAGKLTPYDIESMLSKVKDGDMQIIARLLVEMKNENEQAQKRVKIQSLFSLCASVLCLILLIVMLVTVKKFIPQVEAAVANANALITAVNDEVAAASEVVESAVTIVGEAGTAVEQAGDAIEQVNSMMGEVQSVVTNLDKSTKELAAIDLEGVLTNVNSLVETSEKSVQDTVKKIDDVDLDSLNKAIKDLSTIISPLAKLFKK
jgi:archaellum component FlaC